ncbi:hypothetical protein NYO67_8569 [Aspergillus flavus]|nr:hypothetical protein NYO67_8569 [Aspergillus flavus]
MAEDTSVTDWVSAVSSLVAVLIGVVTLITVYIGATQLLSQNRMYRHGLSWRSLGKWSRVVGNSALLGLEKHISTPSVSLKALVKNNWEPVLTFPVGFPREKNGEEKGENIYAKASWVNFMEALGLTSDDRRFYDIQDASELINGIVAMPWIGNDLVGICSILGFQSHEQQPSFNSPMPLPVQWSGPLGWIQFRSSPNGCLAEFRTRMNLHNQIATNLHAHPDYRSSKLVHDKHFLRSRLWNSINGFALPGDRTLYLGGADKHRRVVEDDEEEQTAEAAIATDLMSADLPDEVIMRKLFGKKENRSKALHRQIEGRGQAMAKRSREGEIPDFLESVLEDTTNVTDKKEILRPCPGLLSVTVNGELAHNRGLSIEKCNEYERKLTEPEDVEHARYPYHLGDLYMDRALLTLMKEAFLLLRPDGFYFSPTPLLSHDVRQVYGHIEAQSNRVKEIFPAHWVQSRTTQNDAKNDDASFKNTVTGEKAKAPLTTLQFSMALCNDLQRTRKTGRACFSVKDMCLLSKAVCSLQEALTWSASNTAQDLVWAFLYCPKLSVDIRKELTTANTSQFLAAKVTIRDEVLDCSDLLRSRDRAEENSGKYTIPLLTDSEFTGEQVLVALSIVLITFFWIDKMWITDVTAYDATIPQSVLMC